MPKKMKQKGFTLVELVTVIAIIGILAAIAVPRMTDANATARGAKLQADLRSIDSVVSMYGASQGVDPTTVTWSAVATTAYFTAVPVAEAVDIIVKGKGYTVTGDYGVTNGRGTIAKITGKAVGGSTAGTTKDNANVDDLGK